MNNKSRTYNSISNSLWGMFSALLTVILNFIVRIVFVKSLGEEINGLHNLFQNTINVMALMETGVSSAMIIHLYAPVSNKDNVEIKKLFSFYKELYIIIALLFLLLGIIVDIFFLDDIVTTTISMKSVRIYFLFFALSFFFSYLTYYKRSILYAEQNNKVSIMANTISQLFFRTLAIILSLLTNEYIYFLICIIFEKIISNFICNRYVNHNHPYLRSIKGYRLEKEKKKKIINTIKPLFVNQAALSIQNSSYSILIGMLLGNISIVGYYGNYQLIISTVQLLFSQMGSAFTSSFGNLSTDNNKEKMFNVYRKYSYIINFISIICCSVFIACIQDFIQFIFGERYLLNFTTVIIMVFNMYIYLYNIPIISVQNALGLHKYDSRYMIVQAILSIVFGYFGGVYFGINGILIGLTLPTFIFTLILKSIIINKMVFNKEIYVYLKNMIMDIFILLLTLIIVVNITSNINLNIFINLIVKGIISLLVSVGIVVLITHKSTYFIELFNLIKKILKIETMKG